MAPRLSREQYLRHWSGAHGDVRTDRPGVVRLWLSCVYLAARPVAALGVGPDVVTVAGVVVSALVLPLSAAGSRWPLLVALVALVAGLLDGVDGAVATLTGRATRFGAVLDAGCDRVSDSLLAVGLLGLGGWHDDARVRWLCAVAAGVSFLHEYLRARAAAAGLPDVGVVTVGERPTRIAVALMFSLAAGIHPSAAEQWSAAALLAWAATGLVGLGQLLAVLHRRLR